jgi:hypothetical protein
MLTVTFVKRESAVSPGSFEAFWIRLRRTWIRSVDKGDRIDTYVLMVSIGALENGPIAPETRPRIMVCHDGKSVAAYCGWYSFASRLNSW